MLKIKDDVDLKELEKFGVKHQKTQWDDYYYCGRDFKISTKNHHLIPRNGSGSRRFDVLYDLIQARICRKSR